MDTLNILYLVGALLIFSSIIASTLSARIGMPLLVMFLAIGMLAGKEGIVGIEFDSYRTVNFIAQAALACILLDGGLRTSFQSFRLGLKPAVTLATWGVFATVVALGGFVTWLLDIDWRLGMLLAAIVGSTDAAAVFSLLRHGGVKLNDRVLATLELESGANDPLAILLVMGLMALNLDPNGQSLSNFLMLLLQQISIGLLFGVLAGYLLAQLMPKLHLAEGMYAILILSAGLAVFAATNLLGGSGFLAVYLAGVVIGNQKIRATEHVLRVMDSFAWLSQAVLFVLLGLLVTPSNLLHVWHYSVAIALFLIFVARPLAVFTALKPFHFKSNEIAFVSWVGLRGAVPITLAILPIIQSVPSAFFVFDIVFGVVIISLLLQGTSIPLMASAFKVRVPISNEPEEELEVWVGDHANIVLYKFTVQAGAFAIGRHPNGVSNRISADEIKLFAMVRHDYLVQVTPKTQLTEGDVVWYALIGNHSTAIAQIFNDTNISDTEIDSFYGNWILSPSAKIGELPFFQPNKSNKADSKIKSNDAMTAIKNMTVAEFVLSHLDTLPVAGDQVEIPVSTQDIWVLVVKNVDDSGNLRAIGLKHIHK